MNFIYFMLKLSAIIPTYNRAVYLPEAIESIREQTFQDWELIVVDDGSTDTTKDLMEWYIKKDKRIKFYHRKKNMGVGFTRNEAIEKATGNVIVQCDSDDVQIQDRFKEIHRAFANNKKLGVFYHSFFVCDESLGIILNRVAMPFRMDKLFEEQYILGTCAYTKEAWKKAGKYNPKCKVGEEWELLIKFGLNKEEFGWTKKPLLKYRVHKNCISELFKEDVKKYDKKMIERLKKQWDGLEY